MVRLLLVPVIDDGDRLITKEELEIPKAARADVQSYLDERRLLATRLEISTPEYIPVAVQVRIKAKNGSDPDRITANVEKRLYHYINPVCGGPDGNGWPFGQSISVSEIYTVIQGTANIDDITEAKIFSIDPESGERLEAATKIIIPPDGLICSNQHEIIIE